MTRALLLGAGSIGAAIADLLSTSGYHHVAVGDGEPREFLPLAGYEQFSLGGVTCEASNNSAGLGTLCETLKGRVDNLNYKTIRYPGHCEQ
jgi:saccharopine dehydrogenase-like NADP-dependent oxidoreductase